MTTHRQTSGAELLPWNRIVTPHIDIVQGQLSMDTYAANLGKVVQGDHSVRPVYRDAHAALHHLQRGADAIGAATNPLHK